MKTSQRRTVLGAAIAGAGLLGAWAYWASLTPATHPDHDHGILNLDAGGRLVVETRDGKTRNLVGAPKKVLVVHFFSTTAPGAAEELGALLAYQRGLAADKGVEFVLIARDPDWKTIDAWLAANKLAPPVPSSFVLDPSGDATYKLNSKRPLETMFFNAQGKLASQARGRLSWEMDASERIEQARGGATIE